MKNYPQVTLDYNGQLLLQMDDILIDSFLNSSFFKINLKSRVESIDLNEITFRPDLVYTDYQKIIDLLNSKQDKVGYRLVITEKLSNYIESKDLHINERYRLGVELKTDISRLQDKYELFKETVNSSMSRQLREKQMRDAFYMFGMNKSGNFSVPGSGKTASALGVFAFLKNNDLVDRIVMIGPKNSFGSWIDEFGNCFGDKEKLRLFNCHDPKYRSTQDAKQALMFDSGNCNLFLFNYESLHAYEDVLAPMVANRTLLVFDEIHKVKRVKGSYAKSALKVSRGASYVIAMTGTPIPNSYKDIYNLLHILFSDEYNEFFGFDVGYLNAPSKNEMLEINQRIQPFFCRTSKKELSVPDANEDIFVDVPSTEKEQMVFDIIRKKYQKNHLVLFIRLLQLESNPDLLLHAIDIEEFKKVMDIDVDVEDIDYVDYSQDIVNAIKSISTSSKKRECIETVAKLARDGKPVIVWCYLTDSIRSIQSLLNKEGIRTKVIYGEVALEDRLQIIQDFKDGVFEVLITNPHTLAESVSLHSICHDAVYFEYSYNLVHLLQSKDRIHRLGLPQDQYTQYYFMRSVFENEGEEYSFDEKVYDRLKYKEQIMLDAIDNNVLEPAYTTEEDLEIIFGDLL